MDSNNLVLLKDETKIHNKVSKKMNSCLLTRCTIFCHISINQNRLTLCLVIFLMTDLEVEMTKWNCQEQMQKHQNRLLSKHVKRPPWDPKLVGIVDWHLEGPD